MKSANGRLRSLCRVIMGRILKSARLGERRQTERRRARIRFIGEGSRRCIPVMLFTGSMIGDASFHSGSDD